MKILLILSVLIQLTYAVEFFKSGEISSDTPTICNEAHCLILPFNYVNPNDTTFTFEITFKQKNAYFSIYFKNHESSTLYAPVRPNTISLSTKTGMRYEKTLDNNLSEASSYTLKVNHTPILNGSISQMSLLQDATEIFKSEEILSLFSFFNNIEINYQGSLPCAPGETCEESMLEIESYKFTVTPATTKRNVVVVPMF